MSAGALTTKQRRAEIDAAIGELRVLVADMAWLLAATMRQCGGGTAAPQVRNSQVVQHFHGPV